MADLFFYQPDGTDIEPYPFDGTLTEVTIPGLVALLGVIYGMFVQDDGLSVPSGDTGDGSFTTINFIGGTVTDAGGGVADVEFTGGTGGGWARTFAVMGC